jgi:hypothetical protein
VVAERERRASADVVADAITSAVMASGDLLRVSMPTRDRDAYGNYVPVELQFFAASIRAGSDTTDWHSAPRPQFVISEVYRRWQLIPEVLEGARREFVRESAGLLALPRDLARTVTAQRALLADAVLVASECAAIYGRLVTLEMNGGVASHKERAEAHLSGRRSRLALAIEELVDAHRRGLDVAWREMPERMGELFDTDGYRKAQNAARFVQDAQDALRETVENAVGVREDAAGVAGTDAAEPSEWLHRSSVRDRLPRITLADLLEEAFCFEHGQEINGWNWVSAQILSARQRFIALRAESVDFLPPTPAVVSWRLGSELHQTASAAELVARSFQMHPDDRGAALAAGERPRMAAAEESAVKPRDQIGPWNRGIAKCPPNRLRGRYPRRVVRSRAAKPSALGSTLQRSARYRTYRHGRMW